MNYFRAVLAITLLFGTSGCTEPSAPSSTTSTAEIFYVHFGVETYTPVTRGDYGGGQRLYAETGIDEGYDRYGEVSIENPDFKRVMAILSQARATDSPVDGRRIRLKIRSPDSTLYVDEDGRVEGLSQLRVLSETEAESIARLIESESLTGVRTEPRPGPPMIFPMERGPTNPP